MMTENTTTTTSSTVSSLESKPFRFRSQPTAQDPTLSQFGGLPTSPSPENRPTHSPGRTPSPIRAGSGGDVLLQWGHKKRSRVSRTEIRVLADESSSSAQARQAKVQRRAAHAAAVADKSMPPPPPPPRSLLPAQRRRFRMVDSERKPQGCFQTVGNLEDRSAVVNGSPSRSTAVGNGRAASRSIAGKRSPPPEKSERKMPSCSGRSAKDDKANGSSDHRANHVDSTSLQSEQLAGAANHSAAPAAEKVNYEVVEWPRIYVALSRKEKEDDFLAMKGTKLPQRPKKRAKNIDRTLQYCFPGMWLSDLTRNRYEVREKKCVKKQKRRGLKGMESVESDSE
ncbi:hypothetical protein RchiOBHm_Chr5g0022171 [Rosa chinensis]|uniref:DUF1639 family protein n=1 Tax=Rosa chinensis TaxID=74649 RepID=A0A2P6Q7S1_ROSCH|nr:hypothetical protein RchiOBHm_Chr5g0022171 [Rosa chinensis]